jgi:hypothetical protein
MFVLQNINIPHKTKNKRPIISKTICAVEKIFAQKTSAQTENSPPAGETYLFSSEIISIIPIVSDVVYTS